MPLSKATTRPRRNNPSVSGFRAAGRCRPHSPSLHGLFLPRSAYRQLRLRGVKPMAGAGRCSWSRTSLLWPTSLLALPSGRRPLWDYQERFHMRGADRHPICETTGDNMAGSVNKVILIGNLGAEPEVRSFQNGGKVCNIRIATSESWKDRNTGERKDRTEWHRSEEHTSELQSLMRISYAVFCLKK